jgi:cysteine desulfurase
MWFSKHRVYLDHASAPPVLREALEAMRRAEALVGNPGAIHEEAVLAKRSLEDSRRRIAAELGCKAREIIFTSGLTEANNLAIVGFARHLERTKRSLEGTHWIVSSIEHDSVLQAFAEVEAMGGAVTHLEPNSRGVISVKTVEEALRKETVFVSVGWANNEIGTVQPIAKIGQALRAYAQIHGTSIVFHADAGQAPLYLSTIIDSLGVDLLALGGNKLYGPHGVGALYIGSRLFGHSGAMLTPLSFGGHQERRIRAGTENVALAAGFAAAYEKVAKERMKESRRLEKLRNDLAAELGSKIKGLVVNGDHTLALPHMLNVSIRPIPQLAERTSEYLTLALDRAGFAVSTKSACREGEESRSHVVSALLAGEVKGEAWQAEHTMRISLGRDTRKRHLKRFVRVLAQLAKMSQTP